MLRREFHSFLQTVATIMPRVCGVEGGGGGGGGGGDGVHGQRGVCWRGDVVLCRCVDWLEKQV